MEGKFTFENGPTLSILQFTLSIELVDLEIACVPNFWSLKHTHAAHVLILVKTPLECDFSVISISIGDHLLDLALSLIILILSFIPQHLSVLTIQCQYTFAISQIIFELAFVMQHLRRSIFLTWIELPILTLTMSLAHLNFTFVFLAVRVLNHSALR